MPHGRRTGPGDRFFGGKRFGLRSAKTSKAVAKIEAQRLRNKGAKVRVLPWRKKGKSVEYLVYAREVGTKRRRSR